VLTSVPREHAEVVERRRKLARGELDVDLLGLIIPPTVFMDRRDVEARDEDAVIPLIERLKALG
jgi:hypothetical protein